MVVPDSTPLSPKDYIFDLPADKRPEEITFEEPWYPGIRDVWKKCTDDRTVHSIDGITSIVIHATAGGSSEGAVSVMRDGKASFHWLVPDENEEGHGKWVWACAPESLKAWHVRKDKSHPDVNNGQTDINNFSLGLEIVNTQKDSDSFSDWQVEITARIVRACWAKYPNLKHIVSHAALDPDRRTDPGDLFPWEHFKHLVLNGPEVTPFSFNVTRAMDIPKPRGGSNDNGCCLP